MASTINAKSTGAGGIDATGDSSGILALQTGGVTAMTIDTSQNVGIGTTSPSTYSSKTWITGTGGTSNNPFGFDDGSTGLALRFNLVNNTSPRQVNFQVNPDGSGFTTRMTIDGSGNVGIGTTSPELKFRVTPATTYQAVPSGFYAGGADDGNCAFYSLSRKDATTGAGIKFSTPLDGSNLPYLTISTSNAATTVGGMTFTERMRIDSSGNVLIGTTNSTPSASNPGVRISLPDTASIWARNGTSTTAMINFVNSNGTVGHIDTSNSTTSYVTSSDYRLKENITPMTGALNKVSQLKPVTYTWKIDGLDGEGFIAHELAEVCPHAVSGEKDAVDAEGNPVYQGIDTSFLVATLTAAIQELTERVKALENK